MLDVEGFKRFNDTFGHAVGDEILRELGKMLLGHVREEDIACRYGGDEFLLVLPDTSCRVTRERAELICGYARQCHIHYERQDLDAVTLSIGVAAFPENGSTSAAILKAADAALYRAKRKGRGRVVMAKRISCSEKR
jgi:diguanylate cyclase (GGDEF)-like protein